MNKDIKDVIKNVIRVVVAIAGISYLIYSLNTFISPKSGSVPASSDLLNYLTGASIIKNGQIKNLYDRNTQIKYQQGLNTPYKLTGLLAFRTPPTTAYLYMPLLKMQAPMDFYTFCLINVIFLIGMILILFKMTLRTKGNFINAMILLPFFYPIWHCLINYQLGIILTFITVLSMYLIKKEKYFISGTVLGLVMLKPSFLLAVPAIGLLVWATKNRKSLYMFFLGILLTSLIFVGINTLLYGVTFVKDYTFFISGSETIDYGTNIFTNYNLTFIFWVILKDIAVSKTLGLLLSITILVILVIYIAKNINEENKWKKVSGLIILLPLLNVHTMPNDLNIWIIPLMLFNFPLTESLFLLFSPLLGISVKQYVTVIFAGVVGLRNL